jgi:hypothetical protein
VVFSIRILIFIWLAVSVRFFFSFFFMRSKVATDSLLGLTAPLLPLSYGVILIFSWLAVSVGFFCNFFFMRSKVATDSLVG